MDFEVSHYGNQTLADYKALANKIVRHASMGVPHKKNCTILYICCTETDVAHTKLHSLCNCDEVSTPQMSAVFT